MATGALFGLTLLLLLLRPRRLPDWLVALGGGLAMAAMGALSLPGAASALLDSWDVLLFFLGLGLVSATADRAGVFQAVADLAVRMAGSSQHRLLVSLYLMAAAVTTVLSNDATALLLTPVALVVAKRAGVDPRPYAFACALVANAASFVLPVSNPSNLLLLAAVPLPLGQFLRLLLLPSALSIGVTLVGLLVVFRTELASPLSLAPAPVSSGLSRRTILCLVGLVGMTLAYLVGSANGWSLGLVALVGSCLLLAVDTALGQDLGDTLAEVPWGILPLFAGLALLVRGGENAGMFGPLQALADQLANLGSSAAPLALLGTTVVANLTNNLPAALVVAAALASTPASVVREHLLAGAVVGVNLGPNLTTIGSLATMLWLTLLRRRGVEVSPLSYLRVGILVTVPALLATSLAVWLQAVL